MVVFPVTVSWPYDIHTQCLVDVEVIFVVNKLILCDDESVQVEINWLLLVTQVESGLA